MFAGRPFPPAQIAFDSLGNCWALNSSGFVVYFPGGDGRYSEARKIAVPSDEAGLIYKLTSRFGQDTKGKIVLLQDTTLTTRLEWLRQYFTMPPPRMLLYNISAILRGGATYYPARLDSASGSPNTDSMGVPLDAVFPATTREITLSFFALTARSAGLLRVRYRLPGYQDDWTDAGAVRSLTFDNLPHGDYAVEIILVDINEQQSKPLIYKFSILPPWYYTWWAYTLYALLLAAAVYGIVVLRTRAVRRKAAIEQQITEAERAVLEQQLKALRAQINPHFLQNSFDFIGQSLMQQEPGHTLGVIQQVSAYLRNVLYRSDETIVSLEQELDYAGEYLGVNRMLLRDRFSYRIDIDDAVDIFDVRVPSMLLQPLLENAIKHGTGKASGDILLSVTQDAEYIYCVVQNSKAADGSGVVQASGYMAKGLAITEERLALLYGNAGLPPKVWNEHSGDVYRVHVALPRYN